MIDNDEYEYKWAFRMVVVAAMALVVVFSVVSIAGIINKRMELEQTRVREEERNRIIQEEKTLRTKERLKAVPWYKGDNNDKQHRGEL